MVSKVEILWYYGGEKMNLLEARIILLCKGNVEWVREIWLNLKARRHDITYDWVKNRCRDLFYEGLLDKKVRNGRRVFYIATENGVNLANAFIREYSNSSSLPSNSLLEISSFVKNDAVDMK